MTRPVFESASLPMTWLRSALVMALLLSGFPLVACNGQGQAAPAGPPPATPVRLEVVTATDVADTTDYVATVRGQRSATVQPQVDGIVRRIHVRSGQTVRAGTPLVQIDAARQQAAVASREAAIAARDADVALARQRAERLRELRRQGVVSQDELDAAEAALTSAEAAATAVRAELREGRVQLQYHQVLAPASGIVGDIPVRVGDRVVPDTVLTTLDQSDALEAYIQVPVERARDLRVGTPVTILGPGGEPLAETRVSFVSPRAEGTTQSVLAKAPLTNGAAGLRTAQYVRARLRWSTAPGLLVPVLSVVRVNDQYFVYVAEPQAGGGLVARQRPVKVDRVVGDAYLVESGLTEGQRIVVGGVQKILDGAPIQEAPREPAGAQSQTGGGDAGAAPGTSAK